MKAGAKSKYTPELVEEIIGHISNGLTAKDSCTLSDISQETYYVWIRTKPEFSEAIEKAIQKRKETLLLKIRRDNSWQSACWLLQQLYRDEFFSHSEARIHQRIDELEKLLEKAIEQKKQYDELPHPLKQN